MPNAQAYPRLLHPSQTLRARCVVGGSGNWVVGYGTSMGGRVVDIAAVVTSVTHKKWISWHFVWLVIWVLKFMLLKNIGSWGRAPCRRKAIWITGISKRSWQKEAQEEHLAGERRKKGDWKKRNSKRSGTKEAWGKVTNSCQARLKSLQQKNPMKRSFKRNRQQ